MAIGAAKVAAQAGGTALDLARARLHVSATPAGSEEGGLPCREVEFHTICEFVRGQLASGMVRKNRACETSFFCSSSSFASSSSFLFFKKRFRTPLFFCQDGNEMPIPLLSPPSPIIFMWGIVCNSDGSHATQGSCLFVSGVPGTGKTATIRTVATVRSAIPPAFILFRGP